MADNCDWEPAPGEKVALVTLAGSTGTVAMAEVIRVTKTQIVVKAVRGTRRFRRTRPRVIGANEHPRYCEVGGSSGFRTTTLTHSESSAVAAILAEKAREDRLYAAVGAGDNFRKHRDIQSAKRAVAALTAFIQHEEGVSEG